MLSFFFTKYSRKHIQCQIRARLEVFLKQLKILLEKIYFWVTKALQVLHEKAPVMIFL